MIAKKIYSNKENAYKKLTFQVRIDTGWWKILQLLRASHKKSLKNLVEEALSRTYGTE
jgi:hypothetical protein